jgi:hypothetical protein
VPEAEVSPGILNVGLRESRPSDFIAQWLLCARWSQKKERRIGDIFKRETLMFNGYQDEVAHMYEDMDLRANF